MKETSAEAMRRLRLRAERDTWMAMSAVLALCVLLAVAALVLPFFGLRVAAVVAAIVVLGIFVLCYFVCVTRVPRDE